MRFRGLQALTRSLAGARPGPESAISKIIWSEYAQAYTELAMEILGPEALVPTGQATGGLLQMPEAGTENSPLSWVETFMSARAGTIYAGARRCSATSSARSCSACRRSPASTRAVPRPGQEQGLSRVLRLRQRPGGLPHLLRRFLADKAPLAAVRRASETEAGYDADCGGR
jgi:hypothetical protein